jgi:hypothetical protein
MSLCPVFMHLQILNNFGTEIDNVLKMNITIHFHTHTNYLAQSKYL